MYFQVCECVGPIMSVIWINFVAVSIEIYFSFVHKYFRYNEGFKIFIFGEYRCSNSFISGSINVNPLCPKNHVILVYMDISHGINIAYSKKFIADVIMSETSEADTGEAV